MQSQLLSQVYEYIVQLLCIN